MVDLTINLELDLQVNPLLLDATEQDCDLAYAKFMLR